MSKIKSEEVSKTAEVSKSMLNDLLSFCLQSLIHTHEYVGDETLPPIDGWSWFDACKKISLAIPEDEWTAQFLKRFKDCPNCKSDTGLKFPRNDFPYCEDCGFPFEER